MQEACLRAIKFFPGFQGGSARAWLLTIVRHTCNTWLAKNRRHGATTTSFDEELHSGESDAMNPPVVLQRKADRQLVRQALEELPVEFREVIVLRELEGSVLQRSGRGGRDSSGHSDVAAGPGPPATGTTSGRAPERGAERWTVKKRKIGCTATSMANSTWRKAWKSSGTWRVAPHVREPAITTGSCRIRSVRPASNSAVLTGCDRVLSRQFAVRRERPMPGRQFRTGG